MEAIYIVTRGKKNPISIKVGWEPIHKEVQGEIKALEHMRTHVTKEHNKVCCCYWELIGILLNKLGR